MKKIIQQRFKNEAVYCRALMLGCSKAVANIVSRRVACPEQVAEIIHPTLKKIPSPILLKGIEIACGRLIRAITNCERIGILTDYDVDGITAHAVIYETLTHYLGVDPRLIESFIGHRLEDGYGVSARLVDKILLQDPCVNLIITADCGSSDEDRLRLLKEAGIDVIVTDHHGIHEQGVPPSAVVTVNPVQASCNYPDKSIAGCMVAWLVMAALRQRMIDQGLLSIDLPKLTGLLDYVALGTVADAVSLASPVNRAVVHRGLVIMNQGQRSAWRALKSLLNQEQPFQVDDLGFQIGPRINARGRVADPGIALTFLLAREDQVALTILKFLDENNQERRQIERFMVDIARKQALQAVSKGAVSVVSFDEAFHPGVQGIVASRIVEQVGRVCAVISPTGESSVLSGSIRSIEGVHVRTALARVEALSSGVLISFGGHAGAAGFKLKRDQMPHFQILFEAAIAEQLEGVQLGPIVWTDGLVEAEQLTGALLSELGQLAPFGRGFAAPLFEDEFDVIDIQPMGKNPVHLALSLKRGQYRYRAVWFNALNAAHEIFPIERGDRIHCAFRIQENLYQGCARLQLLLECANRVSVGVWV